MFIPSIYLLFVAEFLIILLGATLFLVYYVVKLRARPAPESETEDEPTAGGNTTSYAQFLEQELLRNEARNGMENNRADGNEETADEAQTEATEETGDTSENSDTPAAEDGTLTPQHLLEARQKFLQLERNAAEHHENEHAFWDSIYRGMREVLDSFSSHQIETQVVQDESVTTRKESSEKVFYIEAQGKKIDGEVNKLKDIIYEQENILSSLRKSVKDAEGHFPEGSDELEALRTQMDALERQLTDSRMCMEVLELENTRLQDEVDKLEGQVAGTGETGDGNDSPDLGQMKEVMDKQAEQINELQTVIDDLQLEAEQAEKLRTTLASFTRTSEEMMGCITILEEENEHLKEQLEHGGDTVAEPAAADTGADDELKQRVKQLEEEIIKKEVEYAKLQDEFTSMEKEYLAMYEAMHGDGSQN